MGRNWDPSPTRRSGCAYAPNARDAGFFFICPPLFHGESISEEEAAIRTSPHQCQSTTRTKAAVAATRMRGIIEAASATASGAANRQSALKTRDSRAVWNLLPTPELHGIPEARPVPKNCLPLFCMAKPRSTSLKHYTTAQNQPYLGDFWRFPNLGNGTYIGIYYMLSRTIEAAAARQRIASNYELRTSHETPYTHSQRSVVPAHAGLHLQMISPRWFALRHGGTLVCCPGDK